MWQEALAGGASCKAARPAWGAEGSNGDRHLCLKRGMDVLKKNNNT